MSGLQYQAPLEVKDFAGGLTENPVGQINQYLAADNLVITQRRKLASRPGSEYLSSSLAQLPSGGERVGSFISILEDTVLLTRAGNYIHYLNDTVWTGITGPTGNAAFPNGDQYSVMTWGEWKGILFYTNDSTTVPQKLYRDESDVFQIRTAGLPAPDDELNGTTATLLADCVALANEVRTSVLTHFADNLLHRTEDLVNTAIITSGASATEAEVIALTNQLIRAYRAHVQDVYSGGAYHYLYEEDAATATVQQTDVVLTSTLEAEELFECVALLNDLATKFNHHSIQVSGVHGIGVGYTYITGPFIEANKGPTFTMDLQVLWDRINGIKSAFNAHVNDISEAHVIVDTDNLITVDDASDWYTFKILQWSLRVKFGYAASGSPEPHGAPSGYDTSGAGLGTIHGGLGLDATGVITDDHELSPPITGTELYTLPDGFGGLAEGNIEKAVTIINDLRNKINAHMADSEMHAYTFGLLGTDYVPGSDLALADYLYAFVYSFEYTTANGETFEDFGTPITKLASNVWSTTTQSMVITNIPVLANSADGNYDTTVIKVRIYRTTDGGATFFEVGSVTNGTTTFTDNVSDEDLQTRETLYTTGGVVDNDAPPACNCLHIVNNTCYYGGVVDGADYIPNRVRQAIQDDPDSAPGSFYDDMESKVIAISSHGSNPVALCAREINRLEGQFNELGQGALVHQVIPQGAGCVGAASVIQTEFGIFYAGTDGFYWTDGFQARKVSSEFDKAYARLVRSDLQRRRITATYHEGEQQVWWAVQTSEYGTAPDVTYILHLRFGIEPGVFTTASNGTSWRPTAFGYFQSHLYRGDERGYVFKHSSDYKTDPLIDTTLATASWGKKTIQFNYLSSGIDFGTTKSEKWVNRIDVSAENVSNLSLQVNSYNDGGVAKPLSTIRERRNLAWGDPTVVWGDDTVSFGLGGKIDEWRRFPSGQQRCNYKQIGLTNAYTQIAKSDDYGKCTKLALGTGYTRVTLVPNTGYSWPTDVVGYYLYVEDEGDYVNAFPVVTRTSDTIIVVGPDQDGNAADTSAPQQGWVLKGYPKGERLDLIQYNLQYAFIGERKKDYGGATAEGSAGNA